MHRKTFIQAALMAGLSLVWPINMHAQVPKDSVVTVVAGANGLPWMPTEKLPQHGTFWLVMNDGSFLLPMPFRPDDLKSAPAFLLGADGSFLLDATKGILPQPTKRQAARGVTSADLVKAQAQAIQDLINQIEQARLNTELGALPADNGGMKMMTLGPMGMGYGADDLWLEVLRVDRTNHLADLRLHGTADTNTYQLLYTNNLAVPGNEWAFDVPRTGDSGTNQTDYLNFFIGTNAQMFFRAHQANQIVGVTTSQDPAVEPNGNDPGQSGIFLVYSTSSLASNLNVYYRLSGAAQNGIDYSNLTGVVTLPALTGYAEIDVQPIRDNLVEGSETVTLTLLQTNSYLIASAESLSRRCMSRILRKLSDCTEDTRMLLSRMARREFPPSQPCSRSIVPMCAGFIRTNSRCFIKSAAPQVTAWITVY